MRRQQDRDSPGSTTKPKRVMSRYDEVPRDRSPERRDRRGMNNKSPNERRNVRGPRDPSLDRGMPINRGAATGGRDPYDDYNRAVKDRAFHYKVLLVTNLNHKVAEGALRDALMREFNTGRYGEVTVKLCHEANETFAYVYFRTYEDARDARYAKTRLVIFDKPVQVEPVMDRVPGRRNRSMSPDYSIHRVASPAHSTASANSMTRRSAGGRHDSLERSVPVQFAGHREPIRRDIRSASGASGGGSSGGGATAGAAGEFHHPNHRRDENKKEKFPNYLHHVPPEVDDKATRTLFVGNLEVTISETELRRIFERYGVVEDIDVKRPPPGQGNAYAFIKFLNLDMAHRAKVEMSGQYIGKFQCKIGYGKATPTTRIWVGGLGPWTSLSHLEREFDRFGAIRKIDFVKGDNHAYIQYDSIDAAQAACQEMRGFPLGGPEKRLRVDFADPGPYNTFFQAPTRGTATAGAASYREEAAESYPRRRELLPAEEAQYYAGAAENHWPRGGGYAGGQYNDGSHYERPPRNHNREQWQAPEQDDRRTAGEYRGTSWTRGDRPNWWDDHHAGGRGSGAGGDSGDRRKRPRTPEDEGESYKRPRRSNTPDMERIAVIKDSPHRSRTLTHVQRSNKDSPCSSSDVSQRSGDRTNKDRENEKDRDTKRTINNSKEAESAATIPELGKCSSLVWQGGLVLKNSSFPSRMHVCSGAVELVESLIKDTESSSMLLRITQRLRLDVPKLEDVSRKMVSAGPQGHCILLTLPGVVQAAEEPTAAVQQRPLRNLVTYLKQKDAAGVISLQGSQKADKSDLVGVLYAFPPCPFSIDLLRRSAPNLSREVCKEDYLVVVVVKGSA